jgi:tRNA-2-methylthio-N6-dimethylallyladenosine synthase
VRSLVAQGVKEVTLLGQIVNLYGRHEFPSLDGKSPFVQLLEAVHDIDGLERLRFTSPHPIGFRGDLIDAFVRLPKLVEHVHLPLQSGSDRILKAMHRAYTVEKYLRLVDRLRENRPNIALTTDLIVAFPGETEHEFQETCRVVNQIDFDNAFVFRYSPRRDTPAAAMDQLDDQTKERRNQELLAIVDKSARARAATLVGQTVEVLCEGPSKTNHDRLSGRTRTNKIVVFEGEDDCIGQLVDVEIGHSNGFSLHGNLVAPVSRALTASP